MLFLCLARLMRACHKLLNWAPNFTRLISLTFQHLYIRYWLFMQTTQLLWFVAKTGLLYTRTIRNTFANWNLSSLNDISKLTLPNHMQSFSHVIALPQHLFIFMAHLLIFNGKLNTLAYSWTTLSLSISTSIVVSGP